MRVQLAQQAQEILGTSDLVIITERVDDVALLIGQMVKMGLPEVLDRHIPRHWTQRGLSWGWTAVIWLASIVTEGDHRKVSVETYLKGMYHTLSYLKPRHDILSTSGNLSRLDFSGENPRMAPLIFRPKISPCTTLWSVLRTMRAERMPADGDQRARLVPYARRSGAV
jgi:hypothetical protein